VELVVLVGRCGGSGVWWGVWALPITQTEREVGGGKGG